MAKRKPLVFVAGELIENNPANDVIDINNGVVTAEGSTEERTLKDRFGDILNVKDFGAKGDGITDDSAAFQAAVDQAATTTPNGVIYVPHGKYRLNTPVTGEFISFGHPTFTGNGATLMDKECTDLYDDYVHKNEEYLPSGTYEKIYGDKQALGKWNFKGQTVNEGAESHSGTETHTGSETHGKTSGTTLTYKGIEVHEGSESHAGTETHTGNETHGQASGTTLTYHGTEVHDGSETHGKASGTTLTYNGTEIHNGTEDHNGAEDHSGTETHSGSETHTGIETHNGPVTIKNLIVDGPLDLSRLTAAQLKALLASLLAAETNGFADLDSTNGKLKVDVNELIIGDGTDGLVVTNGKIKLKPTELAGTGLTGNDSTGKLTINVNDLIPGTSSDGFEIVSGKLKVKPNEFTGPALIVNTDGNIQVNAGAGLKIVDNKLKVDFSDPDNDNSKEIEDTLNALMKSLHLPIWIKETTHLYVDNSVLSGTGTENDPYVYKGKDVDRDVTASEYLARIGTSLGNATPPKWGRSLDFPFKTINFAATNLAKNYNINSKYVFIHIVPGTYEEQISLAEQTRTTGVVALVPTTQDGIVTIKREAQDGSIISHTGGVWRLEQLNFIYQINDNTTANQNFPHIIASSSANDILHIRRCNFKFIDNTTEDSTHEIYARLISADGGRININNMSLSDDAFSYSAENQASAATIFEGILNPNNITTKLHVYWFYIENGSVVQFGKSSSSVNEAKFDLDRPTYYVTGSYSVYMSVLMQAIVRTTGTGNAPVWTYPQDASSPTGKKYSIASGGILAGLASRLPGSIDGTPEPDNGAADSGTAY